MRYEISAAAPPARLAFDLLGDDEPPQVVDFPVLQGSDSRFFRAFAFKPTREGAFDLQMLVSDANGDVIASARCPGVVVTP